MGTKELQLRLQEELHDLRRALETKLAKQRAQEYTRAGSADGHISSRISQTGEKASAKSGCVKDPASVLSQEKCLDTAAKSEYVSMYLRLLKARTLIQWLDSASRLVPYKEKIGTTSILEAVCLAVKGKFDDSFSSQLLASISALLRAGQGESSGDDYMERNTMYQRWRCSYLQRNGKKSDRHDMARIWQSIVALEPMKRLECEPVYLMAIAQILGISIIVYHVDELSTSGSQCSGLYLPIGSTGVQKSKLFLTLAIMGRDCCLLKPISPSTDVVVPLVTREAAMIPVKLLLPSEQCHDILPQYLNLITREHREVGACSPVLCAQSKTFGLAIQMDLQQHFAGTAQSRTSSLGRDRERLRGFSLQSPHTSRLVNRHVPGRSRSFSPERAHEDLERTSSLSPDGRRHFNDLECRVRERALDSDSMAAGPQDGGDVFKKYIRDLAARGMARSKSAECLEEPDDIPTQRVLPRSLSATDLMTDAGTDSDRDSEAEKSILRKRLSLARQVRCAACIHLPSTCIS